MDTKTIVKVSMLGDFRLRTTENEDLVIRGKKNAALLASILLEPGKRINRGDAEALLWSQRSSEQAKASLRQCLSELRKQLDGFSNFRFEANRLDISLQLTSVSIDTDEILEMVSSQDFDEKMRFVDQCNGHFLKGLTINDPAFEEWQHSRRLHYSDLFESILADLLNGLDPRENPGEIKHVANKLLESNLCSEFAHMALMRCYFNEEGGKARALQQYRTCCELLIKEIDAPPSQDLRDLYEHIRTTEPGAKHIAGVAHRETTISPRSYGLSVAVFPFGELGNPGNQGGPGFKIASSIRNGLSRFSWLSVASRYATTDEAKQSGGYQKVSRDIDVRYVVDGYIDRSTAPGSLSVELIDIIDDVKSTISWSNDFEVDFDDDDALRKIIARMICQLDVKLRQKEIERISAIKRNDYSAYDCVIRAVSNISEMTPESFHHAKKLFDRAIELDPEFAAIYTWQIYWEIFWFGQSWVKDPNEEIKKANRIARDALKRDPDDALAMAMKAHFQAFVEHELDSARELHEKAYQLNPNSSMVLLLNSFTYSYCGEAEKALQKLGELEGLEGFEERHRFFYYLAKSVAHTFNHDYELGVRWGMECVADTPTFINGYKPLICCLGHLDKAPEAAPYISELLNLDPEFSVEQVARVYPFYRESDRQHYIEGLQKAGVDD